jgi:D-glycero-D-manno-heptose 1,7-bisphosphate phosphatase
VHGDADESPRPDPSMSRPAVFLDRDGTLVERRHYPSRPEELRLCKGVGPSLRQLHELGFLLVLVTNQSGVARGLFSEHDLALMHDHLARQLAALGVSLDGVYYCPHHPEGVIPGFSIRCGCRKPEAGMLFRAARDLDIELQHSWLIGDSSDDIEAGNRAGCQTILVGAERETFDAKPMRRPNFVCLDTSEALRVIPPIETRRALARS